MSVLQVRRPDVFISHSKDDKAIADSARRALEKRSIQCWIAPRDVTPGTSWTAAIDEAIRTCRVMVLIFSSHSNSSAHVLREVALAADECEAILPFRIEPVHPQSSFNYLLKGVQWLDAYNPPLGERLRELCDSVEILLQRPKPQRIEPQQAPSVPATTALPKRPLFRPRMSSAAVTMICFSAMLLAAKWALWRTDVPALWVRWVGQDHSNRARENAGTATVTDTSSTSKAQPSGESDVRSLEHHDVETTADDWTGTWKGEASLASENDHASGPVTAGSSVAPQSFCVLLLKDTENGGVHVSLNIEYQAKHYHMECDAAREGKGIVAKPSGSSSGAGSILELRCVPVRDQTLDLDGSVLLQSVGGPVRLHLTAQVSVDE